MLVCGVLKEANGLLRTRYVPEQPQKDQSWSARQLYWQRGENGTWKEILHKHFDQRGTLASDEAPMTGGAGDGQIDAVAAELDMLANASEEGRSIDEEKAICSRVNWKNHERTSTQHTKIEISVHVLRPRLTPTPSSCERGHDTFVVVSATSARTVLKYYKTNQLQRLVFGSRVSRTPWKLTNIDALSDKEQ